MSPKQPTPSSDPDVASVRRQVTDRTPPAVVEAIVAQIALARDARDRVEREGSVVRDMKGSVIAHPAIDIEAKAVKLYTGLLKEWAARSAPVGGW